MALVWGGKTPVEGKPQVNLCSEIVVFVVVEGVAATQGRGWSALMRQRTVCVLEHAHAS